MMPSTFNPGVFLALDQAPAGSALERILALHGHAYRLEKGQLIVERRAP
ncbi:hypothetical protein IV102_30865 [bacterium]|nr:hypothetical protein [bacterium]